MSNKLTPTIDPSLREVWQKAEQMVENEFDHGDGQREARKAVIAANLISLSKRADPNRPSGVPLSSMWDKVDKNKQDKLLEHLAGLDHHVDHADAAVDSIWDKMSPQQKEDYLAWHPQSKFHDVHNRSKNFTLRDNPHDPDDPVQEEKKDKKGLKRRKQKDREEAEPVPAENEEHKPSHTAHEGHDEQASDGSTEGNSTNSQAKRQRRPGNGDWWDRLSIERQNAYLRKHPNSKKAKRHRGIVRNLVAASLKKIHSHVHKLGHEFKDGMEGLRNFREGRPMTEEQKKGLTKTAKIVGGLVVGALVGIALFTPLGPYAMDLGKLYLDHLTEGKGDANTSESGTNLGKHLKKEKHAMEAEDEQDLHHMTMDMTNWLLKQDPIKLAKQLKEQAEKS